MSDNQLPSAHKSHPLIIGLLFGVLLLSILAVVVLVNSRRHTPAINDYATACKAQVDTAVMEGVREITQTCAQAVPTQEAPQTNTVPGSTGKVGFDYPIGWSVAAKSVPEQNVLWYAHLVPGYLDYCEACDGPFIDIQINSGAKNHPSIGTYANFADYLQALYGDANFFNDIEISPTRDIGGERYTVTGTMNGLYQGPFEVIYFEGPTLWGSAQFIDADPANSATNDAWEIVKGSLDFSGLQQ